MKYFNDELMLPSVLASRGYEINVVMKYEMLILDILVILAFCQ